jgi:hypothetical protein
MSIRTNGEAVGEHNAVTTGRKRLGKKRRIILRKQLAERKAKVEAARMTAVQREILEREKKTRRNREKKVKKKEKGKAKKKEATVDEKETPQDACRTEGRESRNIGTGKTGKGKKGSRSDRNRRGWQLQ